MKLNILPNSFAEVKKRSLFLSMLLIAMMTCSLILGGFSFYPPILSQYRFFFLLALPFFLPNIFWCLKNMKNFSWQMTHLLEKRIFGGMALFYLLTFLKVPLMSYGAFEVAGIDFSVLDQMIPYTALGKFMLHPVLEVNHFGIHSTPIYFLLYPFHRLFNSPFFFLLLHPLMIWMAVFPLKSLLNHFWGDKDQGFERLLFVFSYFNFYQLAQVLRYNFHFEVFLFPLLFSLFLFMEKRRYGLALIAGLLSLSVKEDVGLYFIFTAIAYALVFKRYKEGLVLGLISLTVFIVNTKFILPGFRESDIEIVAMINKYGKSYGEIIFNFITHPFDVLTDVLKGGWLKILIPLLFLPLFSPFFIVSMAGLILITSTSNYLDIRTLAIHYSTPYLPYVFFGAILALRKNSWLSQKIPHLSRYAILLITVLSLTFGGGFLKFSKVNFERLAEFSKIRTVIEEKLNQDKGAKICIQSYLMPHFSYDNLLRKKFLTNDCLKNRETYYLFDDKIESYPHSGEEILSMQSTLKNEGYSMLQYGEFNLLQKK